MSNRQIIMTYRALGRGCLQDKLGILHCSEGSELSGHCEKTTASVSCMTRGLRCTRGVQKMGSNVQDAAG